MANNPTTRPRILGPDGAIARRLPGYEVAPEQLRMAEAVAEAIEAPAHLMVEAGTGVGKSFAYLVPAILAAAELGKKVVISTHTISLQEQLLQKDIPFLRAVMPQEFTAVLVKGRSNYISLRRLDGAVARAGATFRWPEEFEQLDAIRLWAAADRGREPVGPRLPPRAERLGRRRQRERQLPGPEVPAAPRLLLLQGQAADADRRTSWSSTMPCS